MTTDIYIQENKTETFKKGDKVKMHSCLEASNPKYNSTIWTCLTDSYLDRGKQEVVFLEGFSGCFAVQFLKLDKMKKLSKVQQEIVDLLKKYPAAYINKSRYYNHNDVVFPPEESFHFKQFKRPTFQFLEQNGIIRHLEGNKYVLADNYK